MGKKGQKEQVLAFRRKGHLPVERIESLLKKIGKREILASGKEGHLLIEAIESFIMRAMDASRQLMPVWDIPVNAQDWKQRVERIPGDDALLALGEALGHMVEKCSEARRWFLQLGFEDGGESFREALEWSAWYAMRPSWFAVTLLMDGRVAPKRRAKCIKWKAGWEEGARTSLGQLADVLRLLRALMSGHKWLLADSVSTANAGAPDSEEPSRGDVAKALDAFALAAADARANCRPLSKRTLLDSLKSTDTRSAPEKGKIKTLVNAHNRCMHILERIGPVFWRDQDHGPDETVAFHNGVKNAAGSLYSQALFGGPDASWKKLLGMFHSLTSAIWEAVERDEAIERQKIDSGGRTPDKASEMRSEAPRAALTDTEENILDALGDAHIKGKPLLGRAGYDYSSHGRQILSNLVKRGILNNDKTGYFRVET